MRRARGSSIPGRLLFAPPLFNLTLLLPLLLLMLDVLSS